MSRKRLELLSRVDQPLQHGIGVHLKHPRGAADAHAFRQTGDDTHDELDRGVLAMKDRAEGLEKIAATGDAQQLPPGTAIGVAIGPEIAPADPAPIRTVWVRAEMRGGVHLAAAPPCGHDARWRGAGCLWTEVAGIRT